jgi:hypothetical protein
MMRAQKVAIRKAHWTVILRAGTMQIPMKILLVRSIAMTPARTIARWKAHYSATSRVRGMAIRMPQKIEVQKVGIPKPQ